MAGPRFVILGFLVVATLMETFGDAIVRRGIEQSGAANKALCFLGGALLLFGYGYALNSAPLPFGKVVGIYIATLFVMWQVTNYLFFGQLPSGATILGGSLIVAGGLIVAFWDSQGSVPTPD